MNRILLLAASLTVVLMTAPPIEAQTIEWDLVNEYPATSLPGEADNFFAQRVAEKLGGKLVIKPVFDAKSGLRSKEQLKAVASGQVKMADTFAGAIGDEHPIFLLSSLPFLTPTVERAKALFEAARPRYEAAFAARNQKLLYISPWPPSGIWSATALMDRSSLQNLKIRTYDKTGSMVFAGAGAKADVVSFSDLEPKLASGEYNAVLSSGDGGAGRKLWRFLPYFSEINYAVPLSFVTVNLDAWNALDAQTKAAIEAIGEETSARQWAAMVGRVETNYARMRENGMTISKPPPADLVAKLTEAADQAVKEWVAKVDAQDSALLVIYRGQVKR